MTQSFPLALTPAAVAHIQKQLQQRGTGLGLRIGIKQTGCSGLAYTMEYMDAPNSDSVSQTFDGVVVEIDTAAAVVLQGATLDYVRNGLNAGLTFTNPNEKDRCGCGESFRV